MPLTDTQVRNAKPDRRPPVRAKGASAGNGGTAKDSQSPKVYKTKSGAPPKSYKLYDGDNLYLEVFRNGSKIWRFRFKFPKENVISLGKYPKVSLVKAREERDRCLDLLARGIDPSLQRRLHVSDSLKQTKVSPVNLDIEMETGTGKTYCYIKTVFELNKK